MDDILFCTGGGCTAKLGAGALDKVLSRLPRKHDDNLIVGFHSHDDAAVYKINEQQAIVQTLDFFPPMIDDPYIFGQIAATNALSDIYAMGGKVLTALNIVCFPEKMDLNILGKIMQGGNEKVMEAGGVLAGGHSIADDTVKYGLSVTGIIDPQKVLTNNTPRIGDALILTKPLGVGIICTANRAGLASKASVELAIKSMTTLNKYASNIISKYDVSAVTDVTGFGLIGHLSEMVSDTVTAVIDTIRIPFIREAATLADEFILTGAAQKNRNHFENDVNFINIPFSMEEILFDPQTSGGLLISAKKDDAIKIMDELNALTIPCEIIGEILNKEKYKIIVR